MPKIYNVDFRNWKQKKADILYAVSDKLHKTADFMRENKEVLLVVVPIGAGLVKTVVKATVKHGNLRKEEELKERYIYDRSLGAYWKLKRKLSKKEQLEIDRQRSRGKRLGIILDDMNLI